MFETVFILHWIIRVFCAFEGNVADVFYDNMLLFQIGTLLILYVLYVLKPCIRYANCLLLMCYVTVFFSVCELFFSPMAYAHYLVLCLTFNITGAVILFNGRNKQSI